MDEMLTGHSESLARAKAWTGQKMADKNEMCYPTATNNRGAHGRENHAGGDSVGSMPSQGGAHRGSMFGNAGSDMPSQGGAHGGNSHGPRNHAGREAHAYGDMVGPQSGAMMSQRPQPQMQQPQPYRRGGDVDRENHSFGKMVSGAFKTAKKAATPYVNQGKDYAKGQAKNIVTAGKQYASDQGKHLMNEGRKYVSGQLSDASKHVAPAALKRGGCASGREEHSWGSFVRGAKRGLGQVGHALAPVGKAALSGAKDAAGEMVRNAGRSAMEGSMAAKSGGRIRNDHESRKDDRRARRSYDD